MYWLNYPKNIFGVAKDSSVVCEDLMLAIKKSSRKDVYSHVWRNAIFISNKESFFGNEGLLVHDYKYSWSHSLMKLQILEDYTNLSYTEFLSYLFEKYGEGMFKRMVECHKGIELSLVVYDGASKGLIAGCIGENPQKSLLCYGYTKRNAIIFSNDRDVLHELCSVVYEMPNNSYMKDGIIRNLDGEKMDIEILKVVDLYGNEYWKVCEFAKNLKYNNQNYESANSILDNIERKRVKK